MAAELLSDIHEVVAGDLDFDLTDGSVGRPDGGLIFSAGTAEATPLPAEAAAPARPAGRFAATRTVALPGRPLTLHARSTPQFDTALAAAWPGSCR